MPRGKRGYVPGDVLVALIVVVVLALLLLAGAVERGYLTRVWTRTSRMGRDRRYAGD